MNKGTLSTLKRCDRLLKEFQLNKNTILPQLLRTLTKLLFPPNQTDIIIMKALTPYKLTKCLLEDELEDHLQSVLGCIRVPQFSVEECLSFMHCAGLSLQKYKKIRNFLKEQGLSIFYGATNVSTLQASKFRELAVQLGASSLDSKQGVQVDVNKALAIVSTWLAGEGMSLHDCLFVARVDGRPNENRFEVLIGLSVVYQGEEVVLPGGCSCLPLALYEGNESYEQLLCNALPVLNQIKLWIEEKFSSFDRLFFGADFALFWAICQQTGVCPQCGSTSPADRFNSCKTAGTLKLATENPFEFWIQRFVPCLLHTKLRVFSHFISQIFQRSFGSAYWYSRFLCAMKSIALRWTVYENPEYPEKFRTPSYKGAEIDKIIANIETIILESVAPDDDLANDWPLTKLRTWVEHNWHLPNFAKYHPGSSEHVSVATTDQHQLLIEIFDHLRTNSLQRDNNRVKELTLIWTTYRTIFYRLKSGYAEGEERVKVNLSLDNLVQKCHSTIDRA